VLGCSSQCCAWGPGQTETSSLRGGWKGECRQRIWRSTSCFTRLRPRTLLCLPHPVRMLHRGGRRSTRAHIRVLQSAPNRSHKLNEANEEKRVTVSLFLTLRAFNKLCRTLCTTALPKPLKGGRTDNGLESNTPSLCTAPKANSSQGIMFWGLEGKG